MILDTATKKLQVLLAGAVATNQLVVVASWVDTISGSTFVPGNFHALTNGATAVDVVAAPAAATQRQIKELSVFNADTAAATATIRMLDTATPRNFVSITLQAGETLLYADLQGWMVLATNGAIKGSAGVSSVALTMPADFAVAGSPVTTAGTLAVTETTQAANVFKSGPASGSPATPTWRTLTAADLNSLALTSGGVTFGSSGGGLAQDASQIFWDATNHRLGVGLANPDAPVTINATGTATTTPLAATVLHVAASAPRVLFDGYSNCLFTARSASGTIAAPVALTSGVSLFTVSSQGFDGTSYGNTGLLQFQSDEAFTTSAHGGRFNLQLTTVGTLVLVPVFTAYGDRRISFFGAYCDQGYASVAPATGATLTISDTCETLIVRPAGTLAALTINMPANPKDGQRCRISCTQIVTILTMSGNGHTLEGALTSFAVDGFAAWTYVLSLTTWFRNG